MARHGSRLMDFFEDIDRDNSGKITRAEFLDGVQVCKLLIVCSRWSLINSYEFILIYDHFD